MKHTYHAPNGHKIKGLPDKKDEGNGCTIIIKHDASIIEYEITAFQGEYKVFFTSKEEWLHSVASGDYDYRKSLVEYMKELENEIEA